MDTSTGGGHVVITPMALPAAVSLAVSTGVTAIGSQVRLTATIAGVQGAPPITGGVIFQDTTAGTLYGGSDLVNNQSTVNVPLSTAGLYYFIAAYSGDQNYATSTSSPVAVQVTAPAVNASATNLPFAPQRVQTTSAPQTLT